MQMRISEIIATLTELQGVAGDADTNVTAVNLKTAAVPVYKRDYGYSYDQKPDRKRVSFVEFDAFRDAPSPPSAPDYD